MAGQQMRLWEWTLIIILIVGLALLTGCSSQPRIVTREVKVPVPVSRTVPPELANCGSDRPDFRFYGTSDPLYRTGIRRQDEAKLRAWVDSKDRCILGWRVWSKPGSK